MRIVRAAEHGRIPVVVTDDTRIRRDVLKSAYVTMRTDEKTWGPTDRSFGAIPRALFAGSLVGLLPLTEDTLVLVEPRFPANLTHMVNAVGAAPVALDVIRAYRALAGNEVADWMLDHLAQTFVAAVSEVMQQGILRPYRSRSEQTSSPKGRIHIGGTVTHHASRGVSYKGDISYYQRTEDHPANQAIVEGLHWTREWADSRPRLKNLGKRTRALLHEVRHVTRDPERKFKNDPLVREPHTAPQSRSAFRRALPLATALLERRGFSLDALDGDLALSSLLTKTDEVFEDFVRLRLSQYLPDKSLAVVDGNTMPKRALYVPAAEDDVPECATVLKVGSNNIQPDILIERGTATILVIDVKYKPIKDHADRESVIQQLVTYAHRLDCPRAVSVHPAAHGQASGLFVSGRIGKTTLYNYRVNLGAVDLDAEMRLMAERLHSLC